MCLSSQRQQQISLEVSGTLSQHLCSSADSSPGSALLQQVIPALPVPALLPLSEDHSIVVGMFPGIAHTSICPKH